MAKKSTKVATKVVHKISSAERLESLLAETEHELAVLQPQIEKLEKQLAKLKELKLAKQKLITLKLSVKSILENFSDAKVSAAHLLEASEDLSQSVHLRTLQKNLSIPSKASRLHSSNPLGHTFLPEHAFNQADGILRKKTSINYELFRAVVFNGGQASTEQIKQYLLESQVKQPATGQGFDDVELTDISSRINYLVRKGLVSPDGRGRFISNLGWSDQPDV